MSVHIRRPDFRALYPTKERFAVALAQFKRIKAGDGAHAKHAVDVAGLAPDSLKSTGIPPRLSMRQASSHMAQLAGARIVSEHEGLVETLLLSVPKFKDPANAAVHCDPRHLRHFASVLQAFGDGVRYIVVASP